MTARGAIAAAIRAVLPYRLVPYWATPGAGENVKTAPHTIRIRFRLDDGKGPVTADEIFIGDAPATAGEGRRNG